MFRNSLLLILLSSIQIWNDVQMYITRYVDFSLRFIYSHKEHFIVFPVANFVCFILWHSCFNIINPRWNLNIARIFAMLKLLANTESYSYTTILTFWSPFLWGGGDLFNSYHSLFVYSQWNDLTKTTCFLTEVYTFSLRLSRTKLHSIWSVQILQWLTE